MEVIIINKAKNKQSNRIIKIMNRNKNNQLIMNRIKNNHKTRNNNIILLYYKRIIQPKQHRIKPLKQLKN